MTPTDHRQMRLRHWAGVRRRITTLAVGGLLAVASSAQAEPGLTVDPQSPAGVEYAIPLDQGRHHGGTGSHGGGGGGGELFGSGITPRAQAGPGSSPGSGSGGGTSPANGTGGSANAGGASGAHPGRRSVVPDDVVGANAVPPVRAAADFSSSGAIAGLIAAIVCVGVALGLFLRLRARASSQEPRSS
jgi:hypothetical protein